MPSTARSALRQRLTGLSARLLALTILFVMTLEILVFVPSLSNYWRDFINSRLMTAHVASLARDATPTGMLSPGIERQLTQIAGVRAIALKQKDYRELILSDGRPIMLDARYDLRTARLVERILGAFGTLRRGGHGQLQAVGTVQRMKGEFIEIVLDEAALYHGMVDFARRILLVSLLISAFTAALIYFALHWIIVRPMRQMTEAMARFRTAPENAGLLMAPWRRKDEIGAAQRELARLQREVHQALAERARLAGLGAAVARINHDLRNILSNLQLSSDALARVDDPRVKSVTPRIMRAIDRGIRLCRDSLAYGKASEPPPVRRLLALRPLVEEAALLLGVPEMAGVRWRNAVDPALKLPLDGDQMFRVLHNLLRNAVEAVDGAGEITVAATVAQGQARIDIADSGPGVPEAARADLFKPFARSGKAQGSGLGLAIAAELVAAHAGRLELAKSDSAGATFSITLPLDGTPPAP
jgi:signal transduction histidine kinase